MSLLAYYEMDGVDTGTLTDSSGNANHGTSSNVAEVDALVGKAARFDSSSDIITTGIAASALSGSFTICGRFDASTLTAGETHRLVQMYRDNAYASRLFLDIDADTGKLQLGYHDGTTFNSGINGTTVIGTGEEHFYSIVWDGTDLEIELDGSSEISQTSTSITSNTYGNIVIGIWKTGAGSHYFIGDLDDVRILDHAATASELTDFRIPPISGTIGITTDDVVAALAGVTERFATINITTDDAVADLAGVTERFATIGITTADVVVDLAAQHLFVATIGIITADATAGLAGQVENTITPDSGFFRLVLTGAADGTTDITLPLKSLMSRLRSGSPSYLQVSLPYTSVYASAVTARANGDLQLYFVSDYGSYTLDTLIAEIDLETIQISRGDTNKSILLVGHRQSTNSNPRSFTVTASSLQSGTTAKTAVVPGFHPHIKPGDDITAEEETFTVGLVQFQAGINNGTMSMYTQFVGTA